MRVLLTEARFGDADALRRRLVGQGCRVASCHSKAGLCRALAPGGHCPLDEPDPPGLLVDVRGQGGRLTAREFGAVCAVRAHVPVVLVSPDPEVPAEVPSGLENRVTVRDDDAVVRACLRSAG